jgi:predicted amidohydrolase
MRVAVTQFATSANVQDNLATCSRMINEAAVCQPSLIVLPEYANTQPSYVDHQQAWDEALVIDGEFLQSIAEQAKKHDCYIAISVTLRRNDFPSKNKANISVTNCLFAPQGELIHQVDKQALVGHESEFFTYKANDVELNNTVITPFGKMGLLTDSASFESSRLLALSGAQLLSHSLSTFAMDQSTLHSPARACENKVFLAQANKVGALVAHNNEHQEHLIGAGQSQIVAPTGKVLAKLANNEEGFIFADIELSECDESKKLRPDSTKLIEQRRPALYQKLNGQVNSTVEHEANEVPETANIAIFATYKSNEEAVEDVCHYIENNLSDITQLPELFFVADKTITNDSEQLAEIERLSQLLIKQVSVMLRPFQYVCTSLVLDGRHQAVIISEQGLFAMQQQLHFCQRYSWTALGDSLNIVELPLEQGNITVAMLTADDANIPEVVEIAALNNIHLLLVPFDIQESCEVDYSLISRAAEHRICIVAASREKSFTAELPTDTGTKSTGNKEKVKAQKSIGFIANLAKNFVMPALNSSPKFDGCINKPLVKNQHGKITKALIFPVAACNKSSY